MNNDFDNNSVENENEFEDNKHIPEEEQDNTTQADSSEIETEKSTDENLNQSESEDYVNQNSSNQPQDNNFYEQKHYVPNEFQGFNQQQNFNMPPINNKNPKNGKTGLKVFAILLAVVVIFTVGMSAGRIIDLSKNPNPASSEGSGSLEYNGEDIDVNSGNTISRKDIKPDENGKYTSDQVAKLVSPSVVNIQVYSTTDKNSGATASGVILNNKGYIITNDHIYSEVNNARFIITTSDNKSYKASYVAGDKRSDIAVLKIDNVPKNLVAATFADSSSIQAGDEVIAIGSPYGLSGTVTKGIVSYPSRRITSSTTDSNGAATASYSMRVIQTDAALNSGNSGGALVNMYGQIVGINSSKIASTGYEGLCFAIPANDAVKYAKSLVKNGAVTNRARLGITYSAITSASSLLNDLPAGLRIASIDESSELSSKKLTVGENGDIITEINGKAITSSDIALDIIDDSSAGDEITLKIYRVKTKKTETYKVKLLEDTSDTSYVNQIPKATTGDSNNYYGYGDSPFGYGN